MSESEVAAVVRQFFEMNIRAMRGERVDIFALLHEDLVWTMTGSTPVARSYRGLKEFKEIIGKALAIQFRTGPNFGLYLCNLLVSGNRAAVIARGHGESACGHTYNNQYFFFMEVRERKLYRVLESCDGSLVWQSVFDRHLEPAIDETSGSGP
jgi:uncharacterized protein